MAYMMTQYGFHWNTEFNQWFAHLYEIKPPLDTSADGIFLMVNCVCLPDNLCLAIQSAENEHPGSSYTIKYKYVAQRHQIDADGNLFVSRRAGPIPTHRYATQFDFDKHCFENLDPAAGFDWNAAVYKAFISPRRATAKVVRDGDMGFGDDSDEDIYPSNTRYHSQPSVRDIGCDWSRNIETQSSSPTDDTTSQDRTVNNK